MKFGPFENGPLILAFEGESSLLLLHTADLTPILTVNVPEPSKALYSNIPGSGFMKLGTKT